MRLPSKTNGKKIKITKAILCHFRFFWSFLSFWPLLIVLRPFLIFRIFCNYLAFLAILDCLGYFCKLLVVFWYFWWFSCRNLIYQSLRQAGVVTRPRWTRFANFEKPLKGRGACPLFGFSKFVNRVQCGRVKKEIFSTASPKFAEKDEFDHIHEIYQIYQIHPNSGCLVSCRDFTAYYLETTVSKSQKNI